MSIFKKSKNPVPLARSRSGSSDPYGLLETLTPAAGSEVQTYRLIRQLVPIVDAAVRKVVRLAGGFSVTCGSEQAQRELGRFLRTVNVGNGQRGLQSFLDCYLDSMLTNGMAVGEIMTENAREIRAVVCRDVSAVTLRTGADPTEFQVMVSENGTLRAPEFPGLILFTPFNPETDHPWGVSMLRSMPYLAGTLLTIYDSVRANYERSGCLRYAVTCRPGNDPLERINAEERMQRMAEEWSRAMQSTRDGTVRDFVMMGDVDIRAIGAEAEIPDTEAPVRQILEQLVSKTGVPPFLLGLSWSSTERMSCQQADMMTSEIWAIRRSLTGVVEQVCELWLRMHGFRDDFTVEWDTISLQDQVEEAKAHWYDAQTAEISQKIREDRA
ncbi:MAG: serine/threonine protein phosphatase [Ruminococcaceae bacterium]|nr:serine/threonine protein phosphatase [Oscillospiraceae bacterium]